MFSIPWSDGAVGATTAAVAIGKLNVSLSERTAALLRESGKPVVGSCRFNLSLVNRCLPASEKGSSKPEPLFQVNYF
jgi:hypothetical protein